MATFSVASVLGKSPNDPKVEDVYKLDKQLGASASRTQTRAARAA